jgi:hypothetical protein
MRVGQIASTGATTHNTYQAPPGQERVVHPSRAAEQHDEGAIDGSSRV